MMTDSHRFVEVQSSGEEASYSQDEFDQLVRLAKLGIVALQAQQKAVIENTATRLDWKFETGHYGLNQLDWQCSC